jgi:hypothetical protein
MKRLLWAYVAVSSISLLFAAGQGVADETRYDLSRATPLSLVHGVNRIADFDGATHPAQIIYAWRENMNAHGYGIYSVLMPRPGTQTDWNLVTFETHDKNRKDGSELDALYDSPFDGEQVVASVRFVKAQWEGKRATLAIAAHRDLSNAQSLVDAVPVEFEIYSLVANEQGIPGWPFYYFDRIEHFTSKRRYCNADLALMKELRLPLPDNYAGSNKEDGCIR